MKTVGTNFKKTLHLYLSGKLKLKSYQKLGTLFLIIVLSGFIGWVWEFILQEFEGNFKHIYIKGGNFLPWINIYAYGAIVILIVTYKIRKNPWLVFIVSALATGIVEFIGGWLAYTFYNGARYWDYSNKWWGFGNINGFVCPVSIITFGLGALLFVYALFPFCINLALKMKKRTFLTLSITLFTIVIADDLINLTLKNLDLPTAMNFYESLGFKLIQE